MPKDLRALYRVIDRSNTFEVLTDIDNNLYLSAEIGVNSIMEGLTSKHTLLLTKDAYEGITTNIDAIEALSPEAEAQSFSFWFSYNQLLVTLLVVRVGVPVPMVVRFGSDNVFDMVFQWDQLTYLRDKLKSHWRPTEDCDGRTVQ